PVQNTDFLDRRALADLQRQRLRALLAEVLPRNPFYSHKLKQAGLTAADLGSPDGFRRLPFTTKAELVADQEAHPPYGQVLTYPRKRYCRLHQTSGTTAGRPLRWLGTAGDVNRGGDCLRGRIRCAKLQRAEAPFFSLCCC